MAAAPAIVAVGAVIGLLMGAFGVGGSSFATPALSLLGVPALAAIASPLPATIPAAILASSSYVRSGEARPRAAMWTLLGAIPATVAGALVSHRVGGQFLLVASGLVLVVLGFRVKRPIVQEARDRGGARRQNRPVLVAASAAVGFFTGLLANGGAFLLVPLYILVFGMRMRQSVGTSLLVVAALSVPTLLAHWTLGHIDWRVAVWFAVGLVPAGAIGGRFSRRFEGPTIRRAFGWFLVLSGTAFTVFRLLAP